MVVNEIIININSYIDRKIGESTHNWTTYLSSPIETMQGKIKCSVSNIEIPNTYYNFSSETSYFWYEIGGVLAGVQIDYDRNYGTPAELITELNSLLVGDSIVLSYDDTTCKITITNNNVDTFRMVGSHRWSDNLSTTYGNMADRLGFTQDMTTAVVASGSTMIAEGVLSLLRTQCLYLTLKESEFLQTPSQSRVPTPYTSPYILMRVPAANFGILSQWASSDEIQFQTNSRSIKKLTFEILDDELNICDLNGRSVTFQLHISID